MSLGGAAAPIADSAILTADTDLANVVTSGAHQGFRENLCLNALLLLFLLFFIIIIAIVIVNIIIIILL